MTRTRFTAPASHAVRKETPMRLGGRSLSCYHVMLLSALVLTLAREARAQCPHQGLVRFGPVSAATFGYPAYYVDHNGLALGTCLDPANPLCGLPPLPNPAAAPN